MDAAQINELNAEVKRLEEAMNSERTMERRTAKTTMVITVGLCLTICAFLLANYVNLSKNWAPENFTASLQKEITELSPVAMHELNMLGKELLPVYAQEGRKQLMALAPDVTNMCEEQLDLLCGDLMKQVHDRMHASQERMMEKAEAAIQQCYPTLHEPSQREILANKFRTQTENALANSVVSFERKFSKDVDAVKEALFKMDVTDTGESTVDLQKKFIHLWLQVLDQEVMAL